MSRKKNRYPRTGKQNAVHPVNPVNPVTGSLAQRPFTSDLPPGEEGITSQMQRRKLPPLHPMPASVVIGWDFAAPGSRDRTVTATLGIDEFRQDSPPTFPPNKLEDEWPFLPPTASQSRGCNIVAALAVFAFAAFIIGVVLWLANR